LASRAAFCFTTTTTFRRQPRQRPAGPHHRAAEAPETHPPGSAPAEAGPDQRGYNEATLATAWRETTNQAMAASIMGYIRQAAFGDPLVPYDQRVDKALQRILASRSWTTPQRHWL
jgi:hypothetical protein